MKIFVMVACLVLGSLEACTGIRLTAKDGSVVHGRTLEFGIPLETKIAVIPRGMQFTGMTPLGKGLVYTTKYAAVGALLSNDPSMADGMNEKGLSVGTFFFAGCASYTPVSAANQSRGLSAMDFPNWILSQFATIDEVLEGIQTVVITPTQLSEWGRVAPPFHYIVYEKSGRSIVIEPVDGRLVVHENPLGVLTNSPTFDWHMTNLRNYINLRSVNAAPLKIEGMTLSPMGLGSGMWGLPGDFTPPSRFVRAAIFCFTAIPPDNAAQGVLQSFHILNQFDIPRGVSRELDGSRVEIDATLVTCVRDPQSLKYYFKTYEDQTIRVVDLSSFDLNANVVKKMASKGLETYIDVSSKLR